MAKQLQIVGVQGVLIVTRCQGDCPFNYDCIECKLSDVQLTDLDIPKDCPLPDAPEVPADVWPDDENHRLGPKGERLIAVDYAGPWDNCRACFYTCRHADDEQGCRGFDRSDGRSIHWELAENRK